MGIAGVLAQGGDDGGFTWAGEVDAPDFPNGADWINTTGPISIADLQGKIVILDFWTYGCINCIHIIPQLKQLEAEYPDELVVIGVHSAKFDNEGQTENIRQIVQRYELEHPVINDHDFVVWEDYSIRFWPTLMLIDPLGKVVGRMEGEPIYDRMQPIIQTMVEEYGAAGFLNLDPLPQWQRGMVEDKHNDPLRFPGKVLADPEGNRLFIADSNHNRVIVTALDTFEVQDVIGGLDEGLVDGDYATARFFRPQGVALVENMLFVADTENHAIRAVNLDTREVTTAAGTGEQGFNYDNGGFGPDMALSSPWDLVAFDNKLYIAMAGPHQLWVYNLDTAEIGPYAGSGREQLTDGPLREGALNQPSGIDTDGTVLYFADAEASAIRTADLDPNGDLNTIVGTGLFDFGDVDGVGDDVRLQHPLGVTVSENGLLYVADTYNSKIKRIDPATRESVTFAGTGEAGLADGTRDAQFYEPGGLDYADGKLYVADTNNHAIRVIDTASGAVSTVIFPNVDVLLPDGADEADSTAVEDSGLDTSIDLGSGMGEDVILLPPQVVGVGDGTIVINVTMPEGYKLNDLAPFTAIWPENAAVDAVVQIPAEQRDIRIVHPDLPLEVPVTFAAGQTDLTLNLTVYWCEGINETLCFVDRSILTVPLTVLPEREETTVSFDRALVPPM
ncbi:MAG: redoxin domain-containing protein [Anaerolineae bacterium]|nr:redoxin domain-containing protein [Anaerolineae bacterium]